METRTIFAMFFRKKQVALRQTIVKKARNDKKYNIFPWKLFFLQIIIIVGREVEKYMPDCNEYKNTRLISKGAGSLRRQILIFTMSMILICTCVIGLSLYQASKMIVRKNRTESTLSQSNHAAYIVEQDLNEIRELMDYIFVDKQIQSALERNIDTAYDQTLQWNEIYAALITYERLDCFRDIIHGQSYTVSLS